MHLFVSTLGRDTWTGRLPEPNADLTDGPLATLAGARDVVRRLKTAGALRGELTVQLRGGRYPLTAPVTFTPADSAPVTYTSFPGEEAVLSGGQLLEGWRVETLHGRPAWVLDLPEVARGEWYFRTLFVDGRRASRTRLPKDGFFWIEDAPGTPLDAQLFQGSDVLVSAPGDLAAWHNLTDVTLVLTHYWIEEHLPLASFDPATRTARTSIRSTFALKDDFKPRYARYYVENVLEATTEPGEWYLDRVSGRLTYLPREGEDPATTQVLAPRATQLLRLEGDVEREHPVEWLRFVDLTLAHTDWEQPVDEPDVRHGGANANSYQGAWRVPGVIALSGARHCAVEDCRVRLVGGYAVELGDGCLSNRVVGNDLGDLGAGGIKLNGAAAGGPVAGRTGLNVLTDNHIHRGGRVFHSATGILCRHSFGNTISHNHIEDLFYSGISCGWEWGYRENVARDNKIEHNHIHNLGQGLLSDMGGVYTLGVQPGTVIRGNLIHDIRRLNYGGWAIYPDEGTSHVTIENNVCYNTDSQVFHQHYGRENLVRNNIFAFGEEAVLAHGRETPDGALAFTLERNILLTRGTPIFSSGYGVDLRHRNHAAELNLLWDVSGAPLTFTNRGETFDWEQWRALGFDRHSLVADPLLDEQWQPAPDSPAWALGFEPIDLSGVGPRPRGARE